MANVANSILTTDFNVKPYYDDYDESKNFYRILYRPGFAVQARELTQMQTILQKQVDRFGQHIFTEGSIVIPGSFQLYSSNTTSSLGPLNYVKVRDTDESNNEVNIVQFNDVVLTGNTSGVQAAVNIIIDGSETTPNTKTLFIDYTQAANGSSNVTFVAGETLYAPNVGNLRVVSSDPIGTGSAFRISSGVLFSKGHFVAFPTQEVVLDRYNPSPTCKFRFKVVESIVTSTQDTSLLDPALEASNYSAPGADRFKLDAQLQVRDIDDPEDVPDFVSLFTIKDGIIQTYSQRTSYSILKDELAKRTSDESGDYYVNGLNIEMREHLNSGTNGGVFSLLQGGNASLISVKVEPGTSYVKGYEVDTLVPQYLTTPKATTYANVENQIASAFLGSFITLNEMVGTIPADTGVSIDLYDSFQKRVSNVAATVAQTGNKIGSARAVSIEYNSGTLGTASGKADLYLMDIQMLGSNNFSNIRSVYINNATDPDFGADVVPDVVANNTILYEPFNTPLLYYTGSNHTRNIKDTTDNSDTSYTYLTTEGITITSGTFTASPPGSDDVAYTGTLSTTSKREILLTLASSVNIATGITATNSANVIVGTNFTKLNAGDKLEFSGMSNTYTIVSIANSTHLTINDVPFKPLTSNSVFKAYKTGDIIDLTTLGFTTGTARTVSSDGSSLSFDLNESGLSTTGTVSFRARRPTAVQANKVLRPSRYVQINCASAGTSGPFNIGFSDVYKIKQVRKKSSSVFSANTEGVVATSQFDFDNGQKDTHYDLASITPIVTLASSDRLLVELDYFVPDYSQGKGYFSTDSYPIDDANSSTTTISTAEIPIYTSSSSGKSYDLRNHLDFRPIKTITANDATTVAGSTVDPSPSTTFNYSGSGINLVAPSSEIIYDYSYYLGRRDVVHVNKDKVFTITRGVPSTGQVTPHISDNEMALAVLTIAPYPSISPYFAKLIGRQDISSSSQKVAILRQTMRDINVMKERITNLEYYASLSILEKNALDMLVTDENGNDRFKNGIFVDTFSDHLLAATYNPDYRIVVDEQEKSIRPLYSMQSIDYDYLSGTNIKKSGDIITLDYSEAEYFSVNSATSTLNTEKSSFRFIGNLTLVPSEDVGLDTISLPPNVITINHSNIHGLEDAQHVGGIGTVCNAWQSRIVGYNVYRGTGAARTLIGSFTNRTDADRAAQNSRTTQNGATIENLIINSRTGTESFNYVDSDRASIGTRVVNTEIVPYIRPQTLMGSVNGLKPFARFYVFFDGIDMTDYTRPITETEFNNIGAISTWTNVLGSDLYANADGECWFRLSLPRTDNLRFTVGQKRVTVTDSPTNSDFATSFANKTFFAQGVIQTKQDSILSTRQTLIRTSVVSQSTNQSTFDTLPAIAPPPRAGLFSFLGFDCLAYVYPIKAPDGEEGIFLSSVEVFCSQKHPTLGVWFEICEVDAGGGITRNQVPFSEKFYKNNQVPISTDGKTNGMTVTFDAPVFLYADRSYAFIIHPEAGNPNYYFWVSRIGEIDVNTQRQITGRANFGTMFTTNNGVIWVPLDQVDLTCKWNRAEFVSSGNFEIGNKPREKIYLENISGSIEGYGEPISGGDKLSLTGYTGPTIVVNDYIVGNTSTINSQVLSVSGGTFAMSNIRYTSGEDVLVRYASNAAVKGNATISSITNAKGYLDYYKDAANATFMILANSSGSFANGESVFDISDEGSATIKAITNQRYSVIDFEPGFINFPKAAQSFELAAYSNTGASQPYVSIDAGENYEFDTEMAVYSRSNEIASLSSNRSNKVRVNMASSSSYLSPVFDLGKTQSIIVDNLINSNTTNETNASGGLLFNKYISKIVTLAEGQDAEDMKVFLTAYRPPNTDVKVWIKIVHREDSDTIAQREWIELEKVTGGDILYSSISDKNDFKEFMYNIPAAYLTGPEGQVEYTSSQGILFRGYKLFQVKIGLAGTNSAVIPRVADLRTIALAI